MEYFVETGTSHQDVMQTIFHKYGDQAKVMHTRHVRIPGFLGIFSRDGIEATGYLPREPVQRRKIDIEDEKRKILNSVSDRNAERNGDKNGEKKNGEADQQALQQILSEVQSLKEQLGSKRQDSSTAEHPAISHIEELLLENDFSPRYIRAMLDRVTRACSMEDLKDVEAVEQQVFTWIGEDITIYPRERAKRPEVFILVGPTGVGKTTTIAKLAAMYGLGRGGEQKTSAKVRILTIDNYRIGARQQIETYGDIMGIPVNSIESKEEMKKYLGMYQDADIIFVDTIGKSPRDFERLGKMRALLDGCGATSSVHLGMSATTKASDMHEIIRQFEPFGYKSVILTKLDETNRIGNIVSVLKEAGKQVSYVTYGQKVPQDIERATVPFLLKHISGFSVDRGRLYEHFAEATAHTTFEGELHG
ncbi:flagellar biosynthesis protein FlhF [Spirochaeta dissipatitropha]